MKKELTISVIVVTKNRMALLSQCLSSLVGQLKRRDEIVIIDNGSTDATPDIIASYRTRLPIRSFRLMRGSYPELYNAGISHAQRDIVVFLDDDCQAGTAFLRHIRSAHIFHPNTVIQGITYSIPKGNMYAEIMGDHYKNWLRTMRISGNMMRAFDNKNASMPRALFHAFGGFYPKMSRGSEDIELGLRLTRHAVPILLDRTVIAYHHERTTLEGFLAQHRRIAASEGYLDRIVPQGERLGIIPLQKLLLHTKSFLQREVYYVSRGEVKNAGMLPLLYLALAWIRITGYATNR
ncbi:glycosyltransferase [Candidatus Gottesmanbacteria bacterium]|nr:glycosyltransferase [Candidatus Gottesmanbacteria bacterium]